jgi:hypothetical protein
MAHKARDISPVTLRCAPRHSLVRRQRANPDLRMRADGSGKCGFCDVSDVSSAISGPNLEAATAAAANHGRSHHRRAARRAALWLALRVRDLLKNRAFSSAEQMRTARAWPPSITRAASAFPSVSNRLRSPLHIIVDPACERFPALGGASSDRGPPPRFVTHVLCREAQRGSAGVE